MLKEATPFGEQPMLLGFDPGRDKCGVAVMGLDRQVQFNQVVPADGVETTIQKLCRDFPISVCVMGNQTTSKEWSGKLTTYLSDAVRLFKVDERNSSLEARDRYWELYPPQGLQRLIPQGMRVPPRPVDDIVALILIERYLNRLIATEL
jgi:RNase H-fold protein (predicted Holliday junction resolvase)